MAVRKSIKNCTEERIKKIEQYLGEMDKAETREERYEINRKFHFALYGDGNMPILSEIIWGLRMRVSPYMNIYISQTSKVGLPLHEGMLEGMKGSDANKVCKFLRLDIKRSAKRVATLLQNKK